MRDGAFAASGAVDAGLLARLLDDPWFALPPPKSTGREQFHLRWLRIAAGRRRTSPADVQATLLELSATTVADALRATQPGTARVLACGGGVHNAALMARIAAHLPGVVVESTAGARAGPGLRGSHGIRLAGAGNAGRDAPGNLPSVTGAQGRGYWARSIRPEVARGRVGATRRDQLEAAPVRRSHPQIRTRVRAARPSAL